MQFVPQKLCPCSLLWVKAQNNSFNFQRTVPGSLWSIKLCDTRRYPSSTQSYTAVPLTLNHVKAWLTERQIQGLQRVWERDRETNPGAPAAGLRERKLVWKKKFIYFWSKLQIQLNLSFLGQISTKIYSFLFFLKYFSFKKIKILQFFII